MGRISKWIDEWAERNFYKIVFSIFIMISIAFFQYEKKYFDIYFLDLLPSRHEFFELNYSYKADPGYSVDGVDALDRSILEEYENRDSILIGKINSRKLHNKILNNFKYNMRRPNVLLCDAKVVGIRWGKPSLYPNILDITCEPHPIHVRAQSDQD